jgi:hypothetical protein
VLYIVVIPVFDVIDRILNGVGQYFLDSNNNTTTFETNLYIIQFVPIVFFAVLWSYGRYRVDTDEGKVSKNLSYFRGIAIFIGIVATYAIVSLFFSLLCHL